MRVFRRRRSPLVALIQAYTPAPSRLVAIRSVSGEVVGWRLAA